MQYLDTISRKFTIVVECGASQVSLKGDLISGVWCKVPKLVRPDVKRSVAEDLLNGVEPLGSVPFDKAALSFTRNYGALMYPFRHGAAFEFKVSKWIDCQQGLRSIWQQWSREGREIIRIETNPHEYFDIVAGELRFRTQSLDTYILLEMAAVPRARLRVCPNIGSGCKTPYFIAQDLRNRYCSPRCASKGVREAKLRWWNENSKEKQGVSRKTR